MPSKTEQLQAEVRDAFTALEAAADAIQAADPSDEAVNVDALETEFAEAERSHKVAVDLLERAERIEAARAALPVAPAVDDKAGAVSERSSVSVGNEPLVYRSAHEGGTESFFADVYKSRKGDTVAAERLERHGRQAAELRAGINSTDGTGGDFVFPVYLMNQWLKLARAGRPFANAVTQMQLPLGTDSINLPKVSSGASVAKQADGGNVSSTDITTGVVSVPVNTAAGQQDFSRQLFDRTIAAGMGIDQVIFDDLTRAYATVIDTACILGGGTNEATGVLSQSGVTSITYTAASPTLGGLYSKIADAIQQIHTSRYLPPSAIVMHPRRWAWCLAALDSQNRPLIVPAAGGNQAVNADGLLAQVASENIVGSIQGLPVIVDSSLPTVMSGATLTGGAQDPVLVTRLEDLYLYEDGAPRLRIFEETLSGSLQIRAQVYGYYGFTAGRYPASTAKITGTGVTTPSF
jgi:HK97 family phage major capsid protein